jgi:hypothetical protein
MLDRVRAALTPLAERVLDHYRHARPVWGAEFEIESRSFTEELLRDTDPADLVASLVIPLPAITVEPHDPLGWQEERGYHQTLSDGLERLEKAPVADWRLSDQQIAAALVSYERMILADPHTGLQTRAFLAGVMRRAASGSPVVRAALVAFTDSALQGQDDLDAWWAAKGREIQLLRDRTIADAGPLLGPALEYLLEYDRNLSPGCGSHDKPVQNLLGADALAKGKAFSHLLDLIVTSNACSDEKPAQEFCYDNLQALARRNGLFSHELPPSERPTPRIDMLAIEMSKGKMDLADPDRDHARLIFLLTCREHHPNEIPRLISRQILKRLLKTVQAHPGGQTAQALKKLIEHSRYLPWASDAREALRDGECNAGGDPEPAASLPPIELQEFADLDELEEHFRNLLEPRLYDQAHSDYLEHRAKLSYAIEAVPGGDGRRQEIRRLVRAAGVKFEEDEEEDDEFADNELYCTVMSADRYRLLHELRGAFRPLVMSQPDAVQKLESLAHQIEKRPAPSAKWLSDARAVRDILPDEMWLDHLRRICGVGSSTAEHRGMPGEPYLRTMIYVAGLLPAEDVGPVLTDYAVKQCYVTRKGTRIASEKLGNACVWSLAELPDGAGVPYLARVLARVKYPKIKAKIDAALNEAAQTAGIGRAELDEISVPTHGLDRDGSRRVAFAQGAAVFRVAGSGATLDWFNEAGKQLKSPSKAMKDQKELFKEIQSDLKELNADLGVQPQRLQQLYLQSRSWPADIWRARYLDHPLMRGLARKLIWWIDGPDGKSVAALPDEAGESLLDVAGHRVSLDGARVRLWHPMDADVAAVAGWRDRLGALQLTQPFAQVWREVYALTDAERATATYTNRWAAHILKQHQAMTLARLNGWRVTHRMWVDAANNEPWHLIIPAYNLVADYWVKGAGGDDPPVSDSGAYVYVSTDRVQFHRIPEGAADSATGPRRGDPVPLAEIPPVVYSEIMRHADLFTAVASIAADPNWLDRGGDAEHPSQWGRHADDYWRETNTAALVESGQRRRAMLERIVPRLKIASKLKLEDRYLVVQGTRHEYEIHLGSGACSRGGRHICIVPKSTAEGDKIWLPFEGDRTLSIILSKALLLAADDKITDPVILAQL